MRAEMPGTVDSMTVEEFGYTAFDPEDQADAAARRPRSDLTDWATSEGLEYLGQQTPGAFAGVLPLWPQHLFNVARGCFPSGRFGVIGHRLYEIETWEGSIRDPGSYYGSRYTTKRSLKSFAGISMDEATGPFDGNRIFAPTTTTAVRAPETALIPRFTIRNSDRMSKMNSPKLDAFGTPHLRMVGSQFIDERMLAGIAGAVCPTLAAFQDPLVEVRSAHGAVALTVNGYRDSAEELSRLMAAVSEMADGLGALTQQWWPTSEPLDFSGSWGAPDPATHPPGWWRSPPELHDAYNRAAEERGLTREDPVMFHRHLPHCPIPGTADAVMRGELATAEGPVPVRLSWHVQGMSTSGYTRGGACFPAPQNASDGPVGAVFDPHSDMYLEVSDGLLFVWNRERLKGRLDSAPLLANAHAWWQRYASAR